MFGRKKSSDLQAQRSASSGQESDIDVLAQRWKEGDESAATEYWNAVMRLDRWYFIGRRSMEQGNIQPFIGTVEGNRPMVQAFTSSERATEGVKQLDLSDQSRTVVPGGAHAILEHPPEVAIRAYASYALHGVHGMMFDTHVMGAFALLPNLPGMWSLAGGKPIDDIVLPPAPGEFQHLAQLVRSTNGEANLVANANLLIRFLHLNQIGLVTQTLGSDAPAILSDGDRQLMLVVASPVGAQSTKQLIASKGGDEPSIAGVTVRESMEFFRSILTQGTNVAHVLIDAGSANHVAPIEAMLQLWDDSTAIQERQAQAEKFVAAKR